MLIKIAPFGEKNPKVSIGIKDEIIHQYKKIHIYVSIIQITQFKSGATNFLHKK